MYKFLLCKAVFLCFIAIRKLDKKEHLQMQMLLWLPNEDLNPDKQSQSLSCCRYTIGQYLSCFIIIVTFCPFVNSSLKFF